MEQYIDKSAVVAEAKDLYEDIDKYIGDLVLARSKRDQRGISDAHWKMETLMVNTQQVLSYFLDTLEAKDIQEESVSNDLEEAVNAYIGYAPDIDECSSVYGKRQAFKAGAKWQKENLWKPADGDDLPEVDREVIALVEENEHYEAVFAHRPPEYWDGKNILTGEVTRYEPKRYDKGGWNIPDVRWWLDCELPKMEE